MSGCASRRSSVREKNTWHGKKENGPKAASVASKTRNICGELARGRTPLRVKRERLTPEVKQIRSVPQVLERRRRKVRGRMGVTPEAKTPEFELQEAGHIRRGTLLTHEGDERDEIDVLRVFSIRGDNVTVRSVLTGLESRWTRARVRTQALKLAASRRKRRVRLCRANKAAKERAALVALGQDTTRDARVQRLRALQVIGGAGRTLVERVETLSGNRDEVDAIAKEFILPGARPWRFSSAAPEMLHAEALVAHGTSVSTWRKLRVPWSRARAYIKSRMELDDLVWRR